MSGFKQLKPAQQLKSLMKASLSIDEQPDEEANASQESDKFAKSSKRREPIKSAACQVNYSPEGKMSESEEKFKKWSSRETAKLSANQSSVRRLSGSSGQVRVAANQRLSARKSFEAPLAVEKHQQSISACQVEPDATEYKASLQPVYEPKHYLANCVPIQFIPLASSAGSGGGSGSGSGGQSRRRSPVGSSWLTRLASSSTTSGQPIGGHSPRAARRQNSLVGCLSCQQTAELSSSCTPTNCPLLAQHSTSKTSTSRQGQFLLEQQVSTGVDKSLLEEQQQQQQEHLNHYHNHLLHHHNHKHHFRTQDLRRYSSCVTAASGATNEGFPRRRSSARLRRLSVLQSQHSTLASTSCSKQAPQEIKVTPTQATTFINSPSSRRHTLAIVSGW